MLYKRSFQAPKRESYFLFGPRGVGKTTWLQENYTNSLWINLLDPKEERQLAMYPELLKERVQGAKEKKTIVIDEVQRVPHLLDVVHLLIEEKMGKQFILTGSSSRKLKRNGVNLLAGRALWKNLHPFVAFELKEAFHLEKALKIGMIPLIWDSDIAEEKLQAYVDLYLREEVKAEALVRNTGDFARFLEAMAYSHASVLNLSNVARECQVAQKTASLHLQILQDLLLGTTIPIFEQRAKRAVIQHPKFYYFDAGVFRTLRRQAFLDHSTEAEGAALEGIVGEHLRTWIDSQKEKHSLHFWRTKAGLEVDFVVYGPSAFVAIEVKNNRSLSPQDLRGLKAFCEDYPETFPLFLYRGQDILKKNGILCYPVDQFLKNLDPNQKFFLG